jgi:hypothetical protein
MTLRVAHTSEKEVFIEIAGRWLMDLEADSTYADLYMNTDADAQLETLYCGVANVLQNERFTTIVQQWDGDIEAFAVVSTKGATLHVAHIWTDPNSESGASELLDCVAHNAHTAVVYNSGTFDLMMGLVPHISCNYVGFLAQTGGPATRSALADEAFASVMDFVDSQTESAE